MRFEGPVVKAKIFVVVVLALVIGVGTGWQLLAQPASAAENAVAPETIDAEAKSAVDAWVDAVASGDEAAVRDLVAPEFQLVRSDGTAYGAEEYVGSNISRVDELFGIEDIVATSYGDYLVVRYAIDLKESVADGQIEGNAPRLTVFRRQGDKWLVVAHANFAQVER